jgi:hypothetical protein
MKCLGLKYSRSETKILALNDIRAHIEPYDAKSSMATHGVGSQVSSQSSGSPLGQLSNQSRVAKKLL